MLLRNYFRVSSSKRASEHPHIGPRSAQNHAQICLRRFQLTASSFTAGGSFQTSVNGLRELCLLRGHFYFGTIQGARAIRNFGYKELKKLWWRQRKCVRACHCMETVHCWRRFYSVEAVKIIMIASHVTIACDNDSTTPRKYIEALLPDPTLLACVWGGVGVGYERLHGVNRGPSSIRDC